MYLFLTGVKVLIALGVVMLIVVVFGNYVVFSKNERGQQVVRLSRQFLQPIFCILSS